MRSMYWEDGRLYILDQVRLPLEVEYIVCQDYQDVAGAISQMKVRGAPAIGAAAAYGMALGASTVNTGSRDVFLEELEKIGRELIGTRPTAVNLQWAVNRVLDRVRAATDKEIAALKELVLQEADTIFLEDIASNQKMGAYGESLVPDGARILTHCNAGALATAGFGTALGVIRAAHQKGKKVHVYAGETRPFMQGTRLTTWELMSDGIPVTLLADSMAGYLMAKGGVDLVIVGADRIAGNGDVANKIGTYSLAVLAKSHQIPFYVAAPLSTVDFSLLSGDDIPIEERAAEELTHFRGKRIAPEGVDVWNPAFDVTPHRFIDAIITDAGVVRPPYLDNLKQVAAKED
ncbi:MAG: S-methyl-5-thioribose-1-phosphate isomerase [Peptococcaceae bacterium]|nr:S-methyl-5-thioribose-1-phosphate isomerase [Peptococcaceae bacterium]